MWFIFLKEINTFIQQGCGTFILKKWSVNNNLYFKKCCSFLKDQVTPKTGEIADKNVSLHHCNTLYFNKYMYKHIET